MPSGSSMGIATSMKFEGGNESSQDMKKKLQEDPVSISSNVNQSRENLGTNVTDNVKSDQ